MNPTTSMAEPRQKAHAYALFCLIVWAGTFISTKILQESFSSVEILFIRFLAGYFFLFLLHPKTVRFSGLRNEVLYVLCALTGIFLYYYLENVSLEYTSAANVSVLVSTAPFFISLVCKIFEWKTTRLTPAFFAGFAVTFLGLVLIAFNGEFSLSFNFKGDLLAIAGAAAWGFYSYFLDKLGKRGENTLAATRRTFFYGLIFILIVLLAQGEKMDFRSLAEPRNLLNLLFLGLFASALCFTAWARAVSGLSAVTAGYYIYFIPVVTTILSFIILGEPVTAFSFAGMLLVIAGLVISNFKKTDGNTGSPSA